MGKNSKRSKSYYLNNAKKFRRGNQLSPNLIGFLCTCNAKEKDCLNEAYNLLNEFSRQLYGDEIPSFETDTNQGSESVTGQSETEKTPQEKNQEQKKEKSDSEDDDIELTLKEEVEALQKEGKSSKLKRRFQQVSTGVNNCLFITTVLDNPVEISVAIMEDILKKQKTRTQHLVRMVPVQKTCKAFPEEIEKASKELIFQHFPKMKTTFYVAFKARNNSSVDREPILRSLSNIIQEYNLEAIADYKSPDLVLNVSLLKNVCCLSLLPHYMTKYCKYNLLKLVEPIKVIEEEKVDEKTDTTIRKPSESEEKVDEKNTTIVKSSESEEKVDEKTDTTIKKSCESEET